MPKIRIENRSAVTLHGLKPGAQLEIEVDENCTAIDRNWRRRMRDSKIDGAIATVEPKRTFEEKGD